MEPGGFVLFSPLFHLLEKRKISLVSAESNFEVASCYPPKEIGTHTHLFHLSFVSFSKRFPKVIEKLFFSSIELIQQNFFSFI